jgi:NAD(P)-dependent dehydrogenase (short-subunit alcohol dehydrogenase family)
MIDCKVALVTGGSRGIGRGICLELAKVGYAVMVNYLENLGAAEETREGVEGLGSQAEICQGDIASATHRDLVVEYTMEQFGRIDLLVNNAGIAPQRRDILDTDEQSYDRVMDVNLKAPYFFTQRVARQMIALKDEGVIPGAAIVNISSLRSYTVAPNYGEYCLSKAGVSLMTKLFAIRLAEHGINVYEVSPGITRTDMTSTEAAKKYYDTKIAAGMAPINRWGEPAEVGLAVAAIARGEFPFSTGQVFHVDGGWHLRWL